jgi:DNA-binding beta-propeller fold protein YncE
MLKLTVTAIAFTAVSLGAQVFHRLESAVALKSTAPDWDYVTLDPGQGYLFIGCRGEGAVVYDIKAKKVMRTLDDSYGANAITLVSEFDCGYTTNGDGTTTVFCLSTLKTINRIKFGENADSGFYDPVTKQMTFTMGDSRAIAFLDAKTGKVLDTLKMESSKLDGAATDGEGNLLMALRDRNMVVKIDVSKHRVIREWKVVGGEEPTGLAYDRGSRRILVGCRGRNPVLAVMDADSGEMVATLPIGRGNDGVIFDPETRKVYTSNGVDANLVIYDQVDANTYKLAEATTTRPYARTMALDARTKTIYMVTAEGTVDPAKKRSTTVATFYPNRYFPDTFTILTFVPSRTPNSASR